MEGSIASRLKAWRLGLGITQEAFADRVGFHLSVLKKYETGANKPGSEALAAISRTGVNMTWLLTGEGEMRPKPQHNAPPVLHVTHNEPALTPQEHAVLELFRALDPDAQREIQHAAEEKKRLRDIEQQLDELRTFLNQKA